MTFGGVAIGFRVLDPGPGIAGGRKKGRKVGRPE